MARLRSGYSSSSTRRRKLASAAPKVNGEYSKLAVAMRSRGGEHVSGLLIAAVLAVIGGVLLSWYSTLPMVPKDGIVSSPTDTPIHSGDVITISWTQDWRQLCPVDVTPTFTDHGGYEKSPPKSMTEIAPPDKVGEVKVTRPVIVPQGMLPGLIIYRGVIEPNCFIDKIWQRRYTTHEVSFMLAASVKK